jgi:hypothetical protein
MRALKCLVVFSAALFIFLLSGLAVARQPAARVEWLRVLTENRTGYDYYLLNVTSGAQMALATLNDLQLTTRRFSGQSPYTGSFSSGQPYYYSSGGFYQGYYGSGWRQRRLAGLIASYDTLTLADGRALLVRRGRTTSSDLYDLGLERAFPAAAATRRDLLVTTAPAGDWLYFTSGIDWTHELYRVRPDGRDLQRLSAGAMRYQGFTWSADGQWLYYSAGPRGDSDIFRLHADGTGLKNLTQAPGNDRFSAWSPDGKWLYFETQREGHQQLYRMRPDGSQLHNVTQTHLNEWFEGWTPDGQWIVLSSNPEYGAYSTILYRMHPDGSERQVLSDGGPTKAYFFVWEVSDTHILYYMGHQGNSPDIYRMNADGTQPQKLTDTPWRTDWIIGWIVAPDKGLHWPVLGLVGLGLLGLGLRRV